MLVLVTKASNGCWYQIKTFNTLDALINFIHNECDDTVVIKKNTYTEEELNYWEGMRKEDAKIIPSIEYEIMIYDDYIE